MTDIYDILRTERGAAYRKNQLFSETLYEVPIDKSRKIYGNSRVWGDISESNRRLIIDKIISVGARYHLSYKDIAYALLICKAESGFNNDASAGTTTASGLGQYTDDTAKDFNARSKSALGIPIEMYKPRTTKRFDADTGVYGIIVAYLFNKGLADKWGFKPDSSKYWQLIYMLHHDGPGYYGDDRGKDRALRFKWKDDAIKTYNNVIKSNLDKLANLLKQSGAETRIKLTGNDDQPIIDHEYVLAVPTITEQDQPRTISSNRKKEQSQYTIVQGTTDSNGLSEPIRSNIASELIIALLPSGFRKLGTMISEQQYQVKSGDTLSKIAKDNNTTVEQIAEDNNINNINSIYPGQNLSIYNPQGLATHTQYVVKKGDTLSKIATDNNTTVEQIAKDNNIRDTNKLRIGQNISVHNPRGKPTHAKHVVKNGDTLSKIAQDNNTTVEQIAKDNNIKDVNRISVGSELKVLKYLRHKPSNSALQQIMANLGINNFNLNALNFTTNHVVKPTGSPSNSINTQDENIFEIRTPVAAEAVNEIIRESASSENEPVAHRTDEQRTRIDTTINITDGEAIIYTFQDMDYAAKDVEPSKGYTVFYDHLGNKLNSFITGSRVARSSKANADGPFAGYFTYVSGGNRSSKLGGAYGTTKIRHTDTRARWVHGGGSGLNNAYVEKQGWRVTLGCARAQNIDLENLATKIKEFQKKYPKIKIKYIRDKKGTYPK